MTHDNLDIKEIRSAILAGDLNRMAEKISTMLSELEHRRCVMGEIDKMLKFEITSVNMPIAEVGFSTRAMSVFRTLGLKTLGDIALMTPTEIVSYNNVGDVTLIEISRKLESYGLSLSNAKRTFQDPEYMGARYHTAQPWVHPSLRS